MAVGSQRPREEDVYAVAAARVACADANPEHEEISLEDVLGKDEHDRLFAEEMADTTPDLDLFE